MQNNKLNTKNPVEVKEDCIFYQQNQTLCIEMIMLPFDLGDHVDMGGVDVVSKPSSSPTIAQIHVDCSP